VAWMRPLSGSVVPHAARRQSVVDRRGSLSRGAAGGRPTIGRKNRNGSLAKGAKLAKSDRRSVGNLGSIGSPAELTRKTGRVPTDSATIAMRHLTPIGPPVDRWAILLGVLFFASFAPFARDRSDRIAGDRSGSHRAAVRAWVGAADEDARFRRCERVVTTLPPPEPLLERMLALRRRPADEQVLDTDVFVEVWPVDPSPLADQPPATPFRDRAVEEAGIPGQRRRNGAAVGQLDRQRVICNGHRCRRGRPDVDR
jgi:hypothetical protein